MEDVREGLKVEGVNKKKKWWCEDKKKRKIKKAKQRKIDLDDEMWKGLATTRFLFRRCSVASIFFFSPFLLSLNRWCGKNYI